MGKPINKHKQRIEKGEKTMKTNVFATLNGIVIFNETLPCKPEEVYEKFGMALADIPPLAEITITPVS